MPDSASMSLYFDDIVLDNPQLSSSFTFEEAAIVKFAEQWDPLPVHLCETSARAAGFPGVTASGTHLLAVKQLLLHDFGLGPTVIASFGSDETRYHAPGRPGDIVHLEFRWVSKRDSRSRPDCGIARHYCELRKANGEVLLSIYENIIIRRRPRQTTLSDLPRS